jgi:thiamine pyrophosphate-dependent acetolactate synthase large subunit-like protein
VFDFAGLGAMGFSLPAALGTTATNIPVIDIDGDGSFIMNVHARGEKEPHLSCNNVLK